MKCMREGPFCRRRQLKGGKEDGGGGGGGGLGPNWVGKGRIDSKQWYFTCRSLMRCVSSI